MYHASLLFSLIGCLIFATLPTQAQQYYYKGNSPNAAKVEVGDAVYYADYLEGRTTAMGEIYRKSEFTAAHRSYPQGTLIRVTRLDNGKSVVVRVNDRGPYSQGVVVDVSKVAAMELGLLRDGRARVKVEAVGESASNPGKREATANNNQRQQPQQKNSVYYPTPQQYSTTNQERLTAKSGYYNPQQNNTTSRQTPRGYNSTANSRIPQNYNSAPASSNNSSVSTLPAGTEGYAIQVASFRNMDNASRQVKELEQKGLSNIFLMQRGGLNKVVIAAFPNKFAAQQYLDRLKQQYYVDGIVIMLR